jgi:CheY-like chemotaxis protein
MPVKRENRSAELTLVNRPAGCAPWAARYANCRCLPDGNDALRKLRSDVHIDILFTDIVMPGGMNGWELADQAKQIRPGLPVLLTSGYALETLVQQGRLQPGAMVLSKPYRKEALARRLREIMLVGSLSGSTLKATAAALSEVDKAK